MTTLTKRMAEDLADYLQEVGIKVHYLHSEVQTLERIEILRDLRLGVYDVVVGINLLREGLDLPEVSLVAILDADKEGFLRSEQALIQTIGRAARHLDGTAIMYADKVTDSMRRAIDETNRRRAEARSATTGARHHAGLDRQVGARPDAAPGSMGGQQARRRRPAVAEGGPEYRARPTVLPKDEADAADQGPGEADEDGRAGPGVREGRRPARSDHRAAADAAGAGPAADLGTAAGRS